MSLRTSQTNLVDALKQLNTRWARVRERWDDPRSREIQKEFIDPVEAMIRAAVAALDGVADLESSARRDCADDE